MNSTPTADELAPCPTCDGMPNVLTHRSVIDAYGRIKCPDCRGTGKLLPEDTA